MCENAALGAGPTALIPYPASIHGSASHYSVVIFQPGCLAADRYPLPVGHSLALGEEGKESK